MGNSLILFHQKPTRSAIVIFPDNIIRISFNNNTYNTPQYIPSFKKLHPQFHTQRNNYCTLTHTSTHTQ